MRRQRAPQKDTKPEGRFTVRACKLGPRPNSYAALTHWQVAHSPIMLYLKSFYFSFFFFFPNTLIAFMMLKSIFHLCLFYGESTRKVG